jgi:hypothetical protein
VSVLLHTRMTRSSGLGEHYEIRIGSGLQMLAMSYRLPCCEGPCT